MDEDFGWEDSKEEPTPFLGTRPTQDSDNGPAVMAAYVEKTCVVCPTHSQSSLACSARVVRRAPYRASVHCASAVLSLPAACQWTVRSCYLPACSASAAPAHPIAASPSLASMPLLHR